MSSKNQMRFGYWKNQRKELGIDGQMALEVSFGKRYIITVHNITKIWGAP